MFLKKYDYPFKIQNWPNRAGGVSVHILKILHFKCTCLITTVISLQYQNQIGCIRTTLVVCQKQICILNEKDLLWFDS